MHSALVAWCVSLLVFLQPRAPWVDTYASSAEAFVTAAEKDPLYRDARAIEQTIVVEVATTYYESHFAPHVKGDHGASWGAFQIAPGTAKPYLLPLRASSALRVLSDEGGELLDPWRPLGEELLDVASAAPIALRLLHTSFKMCANRPSEERMAWYAGGGKTCTDLPMTAAERDRETKAFAQSRHRLQKAKWLLRVRPFLPIPAELEPGPVAAGRVARVD